MFLLTSCQIGAENVFKAETARLFPDFRLSFSRPGFLTFKISEERYGNAETVPSFLAETVFSRSASYSVGKVEDPAAIWKLFEDRNITVQRIHVFERDSAVPGNDFEPGPTPNSLALHRGLIASAPQPQKLGVGANDMRLPAQNGETVADVIQVDEKQIFVGVHRVAATSPLQARYAGGVVPIVLPTDAASRAWLKFEEGFRWSGFPIQFGSLCADIGASPGGGSQTLLSRGAHVFGIDPAEIDPIVLRNPEFEHVRNRIRQTKRTVFRKVRWLIADMNVAPGYVLDVLEELVLRKDVNFRGLLFTLKLFQWELAEDIPAAVALIKQWGFNVVAVKQLAFNRQEIMVAAQKVPYRH